jgi:uncharacterized protein (DUF2132 family)
LFAAQAGRGAGFGVRCGAMDQSSQDPLHGKTLEHIVTKLVEHYGWEELGERIPIRCFTFDPSVKSSLVFLRKTPWARTKVEALYVRLARCD